MHFDNSIILHRQKALFCGWQSQVCYGKDRWHRRKRYLHQLHPESWMASPPSRNYSPPFALRGRDGRSLYVRAELLVTLVARLSPSPSHPQPTCLTTSLFTSSRLGSEHIAHWLQRHRELKLFLIKYFFLFIRAYSLKETWKLKNNIKLLAILKSKDNHN